MITDYRNIFKVFLPIYIVLFLLCWKCMLSTRLVSLLLFLLLTLPVLMLLAMILYYSVNNVIDVKNKEECDSDVNKVKLLCNKWDIMENKCYKGLSDSSGNCDTDIIKNIPKDLYVVSVFIIVANIFFATIKMNC